MNINNSNSTLLSLDEISLIKNRYDSLSGPLDKCIGLDELKIIIKEWGYIATIEEIHDIAGETAQHIDFIWLLVIMGRVKREMKKQAYKDELLNAFDQLDRKNTGVVELKKLLYGCVVTDNQSEYTDKTKLNQTELIQIFNMIGKDPDQNITRTEYLEFLNDAV